MEELGLFLMILAAVIAWDLIKRLLSSYATEKGKNLATKEDIGGITREVESAKIDFSAQIERLKSDLSADIQRQLSIFGKRNEALTQFFEDSLTVLTFLRTGFHFRWEDVDGLDRLIRESQVSIVRAITSYYRLTAYVQEGGILTAAHSAVTALSTLQGTWYGLVLAYRDAFVIDADEWNRTGNVIGNASIPAAIQLRKGIEGTLNALEDSLKEYAKALYAHFHSADDGKALAAMTDDNLVNALPSEQI
jgi:hypothetical protein